MLDIFRIGYRDERQEIEKETFDDCYSLARICEISMHDRIGQSYESIMDMVGEEIGAVR